MTEATLTAGELAALSDNELMELAAEASRQLAALAGRVVLLAAELDRREGWRAEGATSLEAWLVERCGVSAATARAWAHVGERLFDLPHLAAGLSEGVISFDKVRAVVDAARPETDGTLAEQARECTVRQLVEVARTVRGTSETRAQSDYDARSVRYNDTFRTVTAQLPPETYAQVRGGLEAAGPHPAERRRDQLGPAPLRRLRLVCLRVRRSRHLRRRRPRPPRDPLDEGTGLAGELERGELISAETVRRIACDATVVVAVDDDVGHTMYEGRQRRYPSDAQRRELARRDRHCRFPGCSNVTFAHPHHIAPWKPDGRTDLPNLALLCDHHHHRVHAREWSMSGNANEELTFVGPSGRIMTSRPSPLWTAARPKARTDQEGS